MGHDLCKELCAEHLSTRCPHVNELIGDGHQNDTDESRHNSRLHVLMPAVPAFTVANRKKGERARMAAS